MPIILTYVDDDNVAAECTIAEALVNECDPPLEHIGITECTADNVSALTRSFGLIVQHMHEKGFIDTDFLLNDILQGGYQKKEE